MRYQVVESFVSINGEGVKAGKLALFIRFAGCNLKCHYCDTQWANAPDASFEWMDQGQILEMINKKGIKNITLTGGEPLLQEGIKELLDDLDQEEHLEIEVETNGSIDLDVFKSENYQRIAFTMDYKLKGSLMEHKMHLPNLKKLTSKDVLKFVVSHQDELGRVYEIITDNALQDKCHIILSPVYGAIKPNQIIEFMKEKKLNDVRLQLQLHKIIWHPEERGV